MKTVGEPGQVGVLHCLADAQQSSQRRRQAGGVARKITTQQQRRQLQRCIQQPLRRTDVHQQHARRQPRVQLQRWQRLPTGGQRLLALRQVEGLERVRGNPGTPGLAKEGSQVKVGHRLARQRGAERQGQRLDAEQLQALLGMPLQTQGTLQNRRHRPAGQAQVEKNLLANASAAAGADPVVVVPGDQLAGTGITVARLAIERLHPGPQAGGQPQTGEQAEKLHRMPSPVAEQRVQGPVENRHFKYCPGRRCSRCANSPAAPGVPPHAGCESPSTSWWRSRRAIAATAPALRHCWPRRGCR
ncbi:hypothetical protein FQZ97_787240 [compost metagenome]